jgi:hypothetical protein
MDTDSAMIVAEFSDEEMAEAEECKELQRKILLHSKLEELHLLEKFDSVMTNTALANDSKDLKWKLEKMNPARYGAGSASRAAGDGKKNKGLNIRINFDPADSELAEDNVEVYGDVEDAPRATL